MVPVSEGYHCGFKKSSKQFDKAMLDTLSLEKAYKNVSEIRYWPLRVFNGKDTDMGKGSLAVNVYV